MAGRGGNDCFSPFPYIFCETSRMDSYHRCIWRFIANYCGAFLWYGMDGDRQTKKSNPGDDERTEFLSSVFFLTDDFSLALHANEQGGKDLLCSMMDG